MVTVDRLTTNWVGLSSDPKPTECRNGDTYVEIDTSTLYAYDAEGMQWVKQTSGGSSGGGGSDEDTTVVIYDGDVEMTEGDGGEFYGEFAMLSEPDTSKPMTISINGTDYVATYSIGSQSWEVPVDSGWIEVEENVIYMTSEYMPSQDSPQTVAVKITQEQSSGGGGDSDFSIATVTITNNSSQRVEVYGAWVNSDGTGSFPIVILGTNGQIKSTKGESGGAGIPFVFPSEQTVSLALYKGEADVEFDNSIVTASGSGNYDSDGSVTVTGDCTITLEDSNSPT